MSTVNLVYFSWVRERIGRPEETLDLPENVVTIADLLGHLKTRGEEYAAVFEHANVIRAAINQNMWSTASRSPAPERSPSSRR